MAAGKKGTHVNGRSLGLYLNVSGGSSMRHRIARVVMTCIALAVVVLTLGCKGKFGQFGRESDTPMPMMADPEGYKTFRDRGDLTDGTMRAELVAGKYKRCGYIERFVAEPDEPMLVGAANAKAKAALDTAIANGSLPADRYYAYAGEWVYVSVSSAERASFVTQVRAGKLCIWADTKPQGFPIAGAAPNTQGAVHLPLLRWGEVQ